MMVIEIDQSGKLEKTNTPTVVGFSNGTSSSIIISASEKLQLKKYFREIGKRKVYIYQCFAVMIFLLIKDKKDLSAIVVDIEYPGKESLIKNYLLNFLKLRNLNDLDRSSIIFKSIGKKSSAHGVTYREFKKQKDSNFITAKDVLSVINHDLHARKIL